MAPQTTLREWRAGHALLPLGLVFLVGEDFFPDVDSGQMRLHARGPAGTRIEDSLIGRNVVLQQGRARPRAHRFLLGDNSRIELA